MTPPTKDQLEARLHYPLGATMPEPGQAMEVAPGVKWIRMALPFALDHINLWLLRDAIDGVEGWTVVDCCIDRPESRAQWEQVFENALEGLPILRVIVTHMHPDHIGLADWLCQRWCVRLWISATDYHVARLGAMGPSAFGGEAAADYFATHGLNDPESVRGLNALLFDGTVTEEGEGSPAGRILATRGTFGNAGEANGAEVVVIITENGIRVLQRCP